MGETFVKITAHGPHGSQSVNALADTAATLTKIPYGVAEELGLKREGEVEVQLGDGRVVKRALAVAEVEIMGVRRTVPVALAENGQQPLLGYTTMEILGFKVNPVTHELEPHRLIEYLEGRGM